MTGEIAAEAELLAISLGRAFDVDGDRIVQVCAICEVPLGLLVPNFANRDRAWVRNELFAMYDGHRCYNVATDDPAKLDELYERTERESVRAAERATALARTNPALAARCEREFAMLVQWAEALLGRARTGGV